MSDVDLELERQRSVERQEEAADRRWADRMATELWLRSDRVRVSDREINDALAKRNLGGWSSARIERLVGWVRDGLSERKAAYEQRRREQMGRPGRKAGQPVIGEWLDEQLLGQDLLELTAREVAALVVKLYARAEEEGIIESGLSTAWYKHFKPALQRAGRDTTLTVGDLMRDDDRGTQETRETGDEIPAQVSAADAERFRPLTLKDPPVGLARGTIEEDGVIDLEARRKVPELGDVLRLTKVEELLLQGPWGSFHVTRAVGEAEAEVALIGHFSPKVADELAAIVLRDKYQIHVIGTGK